MFFGVEGSSSLIVAFFPNCPRLGSFFGESGSWRRAPENFSDHNAPDPTGRTQPQKWDDFRWPLRKRVSEIPQQIRIPVGIQQRTHVVFWLGYGRLWSVSVFQCVLAKKNFCTRTPNPTDPGRGGPTLCRLKEHTVFSLAGRKLSEETSTWTPCSMAGNITSSTSEFHFRGHAPQTKTTCVLTQDLAPALCCTELRQAWSSRLPWNTSARWFWKGCVCHCKSWKHSASVVPFWTCKLGHDRLWPNRLWPVFVF